MGFKANWSEAAQSNSLKPEGDYECLIAKAEERDYTNSKGEEKTCLNISFVIRNDVEQGYKNGYIFHTLWKRRKPTENDKQVKGYGFNQVMTLGKAAGLPDGKDYDSLEQFLEELIKMPVRVTIKHGENCIVLCNFRRIFLKSERQIIVNRHINKALICCLCRCITLLWLCIGCCR